jgi:transcriptional regulator with XRE-family HTH domain
MRQALLLEILTLPPAGDLPSGDIMAKRKARIEHAEVVRLFAARLREERHSRGMTQAELARLAQVTTSYIGRLEAGGAAPGIDLVDRLAKALATTVADLLPTTASPDTQAALRDQAKRLAEALIGAADRETLLMLNPLLARLVESTNRMK